MTTPTAYESLSSLAKAKFPDDGNYEYSVANMKNMHPRSVVDGGDAIQGLLNAIGGRTSGGDPIVAHDATGTNPYPALKSATPNPSHEDAYSDLVNRAISNHSAEEERKRKQIERLESLGLPLIKGEKGADEVDPTSSADMLAIIGAYKKFLAHNRKQLTQVHMLRSVQQDFMPNVMIPTLYMLRELSTLNRAARVMQQTDPQVVRQLTTLNGDYVEFANKVMNAHRVRKYIDVLGLDDMRKMVDYAAALKRKGKTFTLAELPQLVKENADLNGVVGKLGNDPMTMVGFLNDISAELSNGAKTGTKTAGGGVDMLAALDQVMSGDAAGGKRRRSRRSKRGGGKSHKRSSSVKFMGGMM